ncbi:hypothetical protein CEY16_06340 [Halalkalibacillus sediminis]|uniref:Putative zinc-finger domain-containing protein n=1 Tax=Halalkalibacillus sediminis TaxID=2018042 RepID=A0A2I0QT78_9BACI|nr:zf-HC2 domain-containing protein [Halalkalibacillus sediminis]PKR77555.1 hypothetical protein CEY16_06340 [Halalkalibacillus sediminis]
MACTNEQHSRIHRYFDREMTHSEEIELKHHLMECEECQRDFQELKKVHDDLSAMESIEAPDDLKSNIMQQLPEQTKVKRYSKSLKEHPFITAAAVFLLMMFATCIVQYQADQQISLSKHENVKIEGDTVIVPEGEVIEGDFVVKNANVVLKGRVNGNLTLVNSTLIDEESHHFEGTFSSVNHHVTGDVIEVNEFFGWVNHRVQSNVKDLITLVTP